MQQHQQEQEANFDLLAVFNEESKAEAAETKLHKEGFGDEEVFRMVPGSVGRGEFREHGANRERSSIFLQTQRVGPRPALVVFLAVLLGVIFGGIVFGVVDFGRISVSIWLATLLGVLVGIILGIILGLTRRGRVRGAIGQDLSRVNPPVRQAIPEGARTAVAVRLPDPENISRKSKARAILLNGGGKIDRSVGN